MSVIMVGLNNTIILTFGGQVFQAREGTTLLIISRVPLMSLDLVSASQTLSQSIN